MATTYYDTRLRSIESGTPTRLLAILGIPTGGTGRYRWCYVLLPMGPALWVNGETKGVCVHEQDKNSPHARFVRPLYQERSFTFWGGLINWVSLQRCFRELERKWWMLLILGIFYFRTGKVDLWWNGRIVGKTSRFRFGFTSNLRSMTSYEQTEASQRIPPRLPPCRCAPR